MTGKSETGENSPERRSANDIAVAKGKVAGEARTGQGRAKPGVGQGGGRQEWGWRSAHHARPDARVELLWQGLYAGAHLDALELPPGGGDIVRPVLLAAEGVEVLE